MNIVLYDQNKHKYKTKVSEYEQEIPQSQTADNPMAPRGRATQPSSATTVSMVQRRRRTQAQRRLLWNQQKSQQE